MDIAPPPIEEVNKLSFPSSDAPHDRKEAWFEAWRGMSNAEKWAVLEEHHAAVGHGSDVTAAAATRDLDRMSKHFVVATGVTIAIVCAMTWLSCWFWYKALPARRAQERAESPI